MEYVDRLIAAGRPELAEQLRRTWRNAVMLCAKYAEGRKRYYRGGDAGTLGGEIPVGASKTGGYPDLPPEIPYPEMTGFARTYLKADPRWRVEIVPESSMQLLVQINLRELAESGADTEHLLPETGMLYFFYSHYGCDVFAGSKHPDPYSVVDVQDAKRAQIAKVIWWDGDMQTLRRTAPRLPYCEGVIPGLEEECAVAFYAEDNYDTEQLADADEICDILEIEEEDLLPHGDRLLGIPWTVNPRDMSGSDINLMQMSADEGSVVSYCFAIGGQALRERDFSSSRYWEDCD